MITKSGTRKRAVLWQVSYGVSLEKDNSTPESRPKVSLGESYSTLRVGQKKFDDNILYRGGAGDNSSNSPSGTKTGELSPPEVDINPIFPTHNCLKCGSDSWAMAPDGRGYVCSECDSPHPVNCEYCQPGPAQELPEGKV